MAGEPFSLKIEALRRRLAALTPDAKAPNGDALGPWQELQTAVEELSVAQEELRGQNEEILHTRLELETERGRYQDLFEFAPDAYLVTDLAGAVLESNRAAVTLLNTSRKALAGKPLLLFVAPEDRLAFQARLARLGRGEPVEGWELRLRPRGQPSLTAEATATAVQEARGGPTAVRWLVRDVTARRQEQRLAAIGQTMASLAHESRNALQRGQACLERLSWKLQGQADAQDLLARIQQAQNDLLRLFEDVREYAVPLKLDARPCDLAAVWREAWERLGHLREGRDARLDEEAGAADRQCEADAPRLGQVFRNIFENALAACADPVRVVVACEETTLAGAPALRVAARDNGPGLSDQQKQRIFDPFFTTKSQGTGLGMAIARQIVEAHGGRIAVGDGPPPGAEIILTLPRRRP